MIPDGLLLHLVPDPGDFDVPVPEPELAFSQASAWVSAWARAVRDGLRGLLLELGPSSELRRLVDTSGWIGVGVLAPGTRSPETERFFPQLDGLQFGAFLLRGRLDPRFESGFVDRVDLAGGASVPVFQLESRFRAQSAEPDGRVAAYLEEDGVVCGITAGHVISGSRPGDEVLVTCPHGLPEARVRRGPVGLVDAGLVEFACSSQAPAALGSTRRALEGDQVVLDLAGGPLETTVAATVTTTSELISAALPLHFLTDDSGVGGDSGSLVSTLDDGAGCGIYLGESTDKAADGRLVQHGCGLDLGQAAAVLGVTL